MSDAVCHGCKQLTEIAHTDSLGLNYCAQCTRDLPPPAELLDLQYLLANPPFGVGDRVECRTGAQIYDGVGTVQEMSYDFEHGGTVIYPAFRVAIDDPANEHSPDEGWYTEICLKKVGNNA